jgi:hypothetical protein
MASFEFDREEIEELARKLGSLAAQLSDRERELLLAIFSAARVHVSLHVPTDSSDPVELTLADLQEQILNAFIPGEGIDVHIDSRIGAMPAPPQQPDPINPLTPPSADPPADSPSSDEPPPQS